MNRPSGSNDTTLTNCRSFSPSEPISSISSGKSSRWRCCQRSCRAVVMLIRSQKAPPVQKFLKNSDFCNWLCCIAGFQPANAPAFGGSSRWRRSADYKSAIRQIGKSALRDLVATLNRYGGEGWGEGGRVLDDFNSV